jgi:hypothetical protein
MNVQFTDDELARRRAGSRKLGWALGAVVIALYVIGFFIQR